MDFGGNEHAPFAKSSFKPTLAEVREELAKERGRAGTPSVGYPDLPRFSTGSLMLDRALGGGVPFGRFTNFWGDESQGKSSLAMLIVGAALKQGLTVAYVDVEGTYDPLWAFKVGVERPDDVLVYRPETGERALDIVLHDILGETWVDDQGREHCAIDLIVFDSIGALVFQPEMDGSAGDAHVGLAARKLSTWGRAVNSKILQLGVALITINHTTAVIGGGTFGPTETQPGGKKLRFLNSIEVRMKTPRRNPKQGSKPIEQLIIRGRVNKNKTAPPLKAFDVVLGVSDDLDNMGVDIVADLAGKADGSGGLNYRGLLYEYDILLNKEGLPYSAGHVHYIDMETGELTLLEYQTSGGKKPVGSKATLALALYNQPATRAMFIQMVVAAIQHENSSDRITEELDRRRLAAAAAREEQAEDITDEPEQQGEDIDDEQEDD